MKALADVLIVARFDLMEALRTRRVLVFLLLYGAVAVASSYFFCRLLQALEETLAAQLLVARTDAPGSLTEALLESPELQRVLGRLVGDQGLAAELVRRPPLSLLYFWVIQGFAPAFVMLTSSEAIASEVARGSARYALVRTDRYAWAVGKLLGQSALLAFGIAVGAVCTWVSGALLLGTFTPGATAFYLAGYGALGFVYAFAFLGVALAVSQLTRNVTWSRVLGLGGLVGVFAFDGLLRLDWLEDRVPVLADTLRQLVPSAHAAALWRPDPAESGAAAAMLLALGATYFFLGHQRFRRRDG